MHRAAKGHKRLSRAAGSPRRLTINNAGMAGERVHTSEPPICVTARGRRGSGPRALAVLRDMPKPAATEASSWQLALPEQMVHREAVEAAAFLLQ